MTGVVERAQAALELWDNTFGVEINVSYGMVAAEQAYRDAPELVRDLAAEVERLRAKAGES